MKAAIFKDIENIVVEDIAKPECSEDGIVVKIHYCGICGSDVRNYHNGLKGGIKDQIMGHEFTATVVEAGAKVERYKVGDKVAVAPDVSCGTCYYCKRGLVNLCLNHRMLGTHWPGGFAEYVHLPDVVLTHGMVHHMPEGLSFEHGALSEPASSVIASQENGVVGLGDTVLILGDGPIGCLHLEVARSHGAAKIIMVGLKRLEQAKRFGPDYLIDAASEDPVKKVLEITDGLGADIVVCANPVKSTQEQGVQSVRKRGRVVLFGGVPKSDPMTKLNSNTIHYNELFVVGAFSYPAYIHEKALSVIKEGKIRADLFLDKTVTLDNILDGFKAAESGEALKALVKID